MACRGSIAVPVGLHAHAVAVELQEPDHGGRWRIKAYEAHTLTVGRAVRPLTGSILPKLGEPGDGLRVDCWRAWTAADRDVSFRRRKAILDPDGALTVAKKYEKKKMKVEEIVAVPRPKCPWGKEEAHKLWEASQAGGHRMLWYKCPTCSLEFQVRTWRDSDDIEKHFKHCPECGSTDTKCLFTSQELGPIYQAAEEAAGR